MAVPDEVLYQIRQDQLTDVFSTLHKIDKDLALNNQSLSNMKEKLDKMCVKQDKFQRYIYGICIVLVVIIGTGNPQLFKMLVSLVI